VVTLSVTVPTIVATLAAITETAVVTADVVTLAVADTRLAAVAITETATIATKEEDLTRVIEALLTMTEGVLAEMKKETIVETIHRREEAHLLGDTTFRPAETNLLLAAI